MKERMDAMNPVLWFLEINGFAASRLQPTSCSHFHSRTLLFSIQPQEPGVLGRMHLRLILERLPTLLSSHHQTPMRLTLLSFHFCRVLRYLASLRSLRYYVPTLHGLRSHAPHPDTGRKAQMA